MAIYEINKGRKVDKHRETLVCDADQQMKRQMSTVVALERLYWYRNLTQFVPGRLDHNPFVAFRVDR